MAISCHDKSCKVNIPAAPRRFTILLSTFYCSHFPCWACFTQLCLVLNIFCTIGNYGIVSIWNYIKLWKLPFQARLKSQNPQHWRSTMQVTEAWVGNRVLYWNLSHTSGYQLSSLPGIWHKLNCEVLWNAAQKILVPVIQLHLTVAPG